MVKEIWLLDISNDVGDCTHIKSPLGQEKTGKSPVDRGKLGTKRSIITDGSGIPIGITIAQEINLTQKFFLKQSMQFQKQLLCL